MVINYTCGYSTSTPVWTVWNHTNQCHVKNQKWHFFAIYCSTIQTLSTYECPTRFWSHCIDCSLQNIKRQACTLAHRQHYSFLSPSFFRLPPPSFRKNVSLGTQDPILRLKYHRQSSPSIFPSPSVPHPSPPLSCLSICQPGSSPPPAAVSRKQTGPLCPSVPAVPRLLPPWSHLPPAQGTTHLSSCSLSFSLTKALSVWNDRRTGQCLASLTYSIVEHFSKPAGAVVVRGPSLAKPLEAVHYTDFTIGKGCLNHKITAQKNCKCLSAFIILLLLPLYKRHRNWINGYFKRVI